MSNAERVEELKRRFSARSGRLTRQRAAILEVLAEHSHQHLTADEIHGKVRDLEPSVGLATVYRTLDLLVEMGLVSKISFGEDAYRYELASTREHQHHHLVCLRCNRVEEVRADLLHRLEEMVEKTYGFSVTDHRLQFFGICRHCRGE